MQHIVHKVTRKIIRNVETAPQTFIERGWIWAKWGDGKVTLYDSDIYEPLPAESQRTRLGV